MGEYSRTILGHGREDLGRTVDLGDEFRTIVFPKNFVPNDHFNPRVLGETPEPNDSKCRSTTYDCQAMGDISDNDILETEDGTKYIITQKLGEGGMGRVFLVKRPVKDLDSYKIEALKLILTDSDEHTEMLKQEAKKTLNIRTDHTVEMYDGKYLSYIHKKDGSKIPLKKNQLVVSMQYIEGEDLEKKIANHGIIPGNGVYHSRSRLLEQKARAMPWRLVGHVCLNVLWGLDEAHSYKIIHRDVSPKNVMVPIKGSPKIMDFGISCTPLDMKDEGQRLFGTPMYISPEMLIKNIGEKSYTMDLYGLGVMMYEMLTGISPNFNYEIKNGELNNRIANLFEVFSYDVVPPHLLVDNVPEDLSLFVTKLLEPYPKNRYQSASIANVELRKILYGEGGGVGIILDACEDYFWLESQNRQEKTLEEIDIGIEERGRTSSFYTNLGTAVGVIPNISGKLDLRSDKKAARWIADRFESYVTGKVPRHDRIVTTHQLMKDLFLSLTYTEFGMQQLETALPARYMK